MKRLFVDTSAWIAIYDESDSLHEIALEWKEKLLLEKAMFVLSNYVFDETATFLNVKVSNKLAVAFGDMARKNSLNFFPVGGLNLFSLKFSSI